MNLPEALTRAGQDLRIWLHRECSCKKDIEQLCKRWELSYKELRSLLTRGALPSTKTLYYISHDTGIKIDDIIKQSALVGALKVDPILTPLCVRKVDNSGGPKDPSVQILIRPWARKYYKEENFTTRQINLLFAPTDGQPRELVIGPKTMAGLPFGLSIMNGNKLTPRLYGVSPFLFPSSAKDATLYLYNGRLNEVVIKAGQVVANLSFLKKIKYTYEVYEEPSKEELRKAKIENRLLFRQERSNT